MNQRWIKTIPQRSKLGIVGKTTRRKESPWDCWWSTVGPHAVAEMPVRLFKRSLQREQADSLEGRMNEVEYMDKLQVALAAYFKGVCGKVESTYAEDLASDALDIACDDWAVLKDADSLITLSAKLLQMPINTAQITWIKTNLKAKIAAILSLVREMDELAEMEDTCS